MKKLIALLLIAAAFYFAWLSLVIVAGSTIAALWVIAYAFAQALLIAAAKAVLGE